MALFGVLGKLAKTVGRLRKRRRGRGGGGGGGGGGSIKFSGGQRLQAFLVKAGGERGVSRIQVGFFGDRYPDGRPVAVVAAAHEFGNDSGSRPETAFMRQALDRGNVRQIVREEMRRGRAGKGTMAVDRHTAERIGQRMAREVQASIDRHGLRDTGKLQESVKVRVVR